MFDLPAILSALALYAWICAVLIYNASDYDQRRRGTGFVVSKAMLWPLRVLIFALRACALGLTSIVTSKAADPHL